MAVALVSPQEFLTTQQNRYTFKSRTPDDDVSI